MMRRALRATYGLIFILLCTASSQGQDPGALVDRNEILIGEQAIIRLYVPFNKSNPPQVKFPIIGDTLIKGVEVVRSTSVDTLATGADVKETRIEQQIFITSFDSGYYAIPPFEFEINGVSAKTEAFLFTVRTVEIDTTKGIVDIREIYDVDVTWKDIVAVFWPYALGSVALIAVLVAAFVLYRRWKKKRDAKPAPAPELPKLPAHVVAIDALELIRKEKIYSKGQIKEYHTSITDALRTYLEDAYGIQAHELTSRQIMEKLRYSGVEEAQLRKLRTILFRADMVKFAKDRPDERDNEDAVLHAIAFVEATKMESESKEDDADAGTKNPTA